MDRRCQGVPSGVVRDVSDGYWRVNRGKRPVLPRYPATPTSEVGDALGDDDRRTGEEDAVVGGPGDGEPAAGDVDDVRRVAGCAVRVGGGDHDRTRAGAAGSGLAAPPLVDAHPDVPVGDADDELDVHAVGVL